MFIFLKKASVDQIKEHNKAAYDEIFSAGAASVVPTVAEPESTLALNNDTLEAVAKSLDVTVEELTGTCKDANEIVATVLDKASSYKAELALAFTSTAPQTAGSATGSELDTQDVRTKEEAMDFCKKKYSCSKGTAWMYAKKEFADLFNSQYKAAVRQ
jgi:hypothetical protein